MASSITSNHYESHSSASYEEAYFYEPGAYQQYLVDLVRRRLELSIDNHNIQQEEDTTTTTATKYIVDVGGGTGNFAQALVNGLPQFHVTVVDPFLNPTQSVDLSTNSQISFIQAGAEIFATSPTTNAATETSSSSSSSSWRSIIDHILLKEVIHHLPEKDRVDIFRGMYSNLSSSSGSILIMTRPQVEIDYPLWDAARIVWKNNQPSGQELISELEQAGFSNIVETLEYYPCTIPISRWKQMIRNRFWSTFSNFTDEELELACQGMETEYADRIDSDGNIHFEDRLVFLSAKK